MTPITFLPAGDFATFDAAQTVLLRSARDAAGRNVAAVRRSLTRQEAEASAGRYLADDVVFHLPADDDLPEPDVGATLTEADGTNWTILELRRETLNTRLRCVCRRRRIIAELAELATFYRAVWEKTPSGVPVAQWRELRRGVPASLTPLDDAGTRHEVNDARRRATHRCHILDDLQLDDGCRVRIDDTAYDVVGFDDQAGITPGVTLLLEQVP